MRRGSEGPDGPSKTRPSIIADTLIDQRRQVVALMRADFCPQMLARSRRRCAQRRHRARHRAILPPRHQRSRRGIHNVLGRLPRRVDPALLAGHGRLWHSRQVEVEGFPIGIEHQVQPERKAVWTRPESAGKALRIVDPVRLAEPDTVPVDLGAAQQLVNSIRRSPRPSSPSIPSIGGDGRSAFERIDGGPDAGRAGSSQLPPLSWQ